MAPGKAVSRFPARCSGECGEVAERAGQAGELVFTEVRLVTSVR